VDVKRLLYLSLIVPIALISRVNVYGTIALIWCLGYVVLTITAPDLDFLIRVSLGPALGFAVIVLLIHILSWLRAPLSLGYWIAAFIALAAGLAASTCRSSPKNITLSVYGVALAIALSVLPKLPFFSVPAYPGAVGHDAIFHAYKAFEMIKEDTVFIKHFPPGFSGIVTYPAGYHSLVVFLSLSSGCNVPCSMLALKVFTWVLIPLGTFAAAKAIFKDAEAAVAASIVAPLAYLYYYYLNYSLLQEFLDYYMVLASMAVFVIAMERVSVRTFVIVLLLASTTLLIHPYEYLAFEAYAFFALVLGLFVNRSERVRGHLLRAALFAGQAIGSVVLYYTVEYPIRIPPTSNIARFNVPAYAFKDNFGWLLWITKQTFIENGQFVLGFFFVVGVLCILTRFRREHSLALLAFVAYVYFLAVNKIVLHVPIPYYSGIWSTERIYVLLTPVLPVIEGAGFYLLVSCLMRSSRHRRAVGATFAVLLLLPAFYVNAWNVSFEKASCVDGSVLRAFGYINGLPVNTVFTPSYPDSSPWLRLYLNTQKHVVPLKEPSQLPANASNAVVYVDSQGCGDLLLGTQKFNPWILLSHHALLFFDDNVWVFNSTRLAAPRVPRVLLRYYTMTSASLDLSSMGDWKYLSYGFLLKHPSVIYAALFEGGSYSLVVSNVSVISFVPTERYTRMSLGVYLPSNETVSVLINGLRVGEVHKSGIHSFNYTFNPGVLYLVELRGVPWYAVTEVRLER